MRPTDWSAVNLSSDPVPGDPGVVRTGGTDYLEVADAIRSAESRLRALDAGSWVVSEAVDALQETAIKVADDIGRAETRYRAVGNALTAYAPVLESAQTESYDALLSARSAQSNEDDAAANRRHYLRLAAEQDDPGQALTYTDLADGYESDAGAAQSILYAAVDRVEGAVATRDTAAQTAIDAITEITGSDDLNDSWWDDWGKNVLTVVTDIAGWVSAIAGVLALLVCWIPVVGQLLAGALLIVAGVAAVIDAIGNIVLASTGDRSWLQAGLSIVGAVLAVVGMGAAVKVVARALSTTKVTMRVGEQITVRQAFRLKPSDWRQWVTDMRTPVPRPSVGQDVFRVHGGTSGPTGGSWTPTDPRFLTSSRMRFGVPDGNLMDTLVIAKIVDPDAVLVVRHALPLGGRLGGAPEYVILSGAQKTGITVLDSLPFVAP